MMRFGILTFLLCIGLSAIAQPRNGLGQFELSVTDKYKARVAEPEKMGDSPSYEDTIVQKIPVSYRINSVPLTFTYRPKPLPPAQIAKVEVEELKQGLVRLGFGLYTTPLAEFYWNSKRSSKSSYGFYGQHLSSRGGVSNTVFGDNRFSENELGGYYKRFYRKLKWESELRGYANFQSYYGIPNPDQREDVALYDTKAPGLWRRGFQLSTALSNLQKGGNFDRSDLQYTFFSNDFGAYENTVVNGNRFVLPTENLPLQIDLGLEYSNTLFDSIQKYARNAFIVRLNPHITTTIRDIEFDFGLNINTASQWSVGQIDTQFTRFYFFPEIHLRYPVVKDVMSLYGGAKAQVINYTLYRLGNLNPFTAPNANLETSFERDVFIGLKSVLSATTTLNLKGGYNSTSNLPLYYQNPDFSSLDSNLPAIGIIYDDVDMPYVRLELSTHALKSVQLDAYAELRSPIAAVEKWAWHIPHFVSGIQMSYSYREKLRTQLQLNYMGARRAFAQEQNPAVDAELGGFVDANLRLEYAYNSRLHAFIQGFNLINTPNTRFLGYDAQGINFLFGIGYQF